MNRIVLIGQHGILRPDDKPFGVRARASGIAVWTPVIATPVQFRSKETWVSANSWVVVKKHGCLPILGCQKAAPLPADEKSELDHYLEIEHLMRLAKARARQLLAHGH